MFLPYWYARTTPTAHARGLSCDRNVMQSSHLHCVSDTLALDHLSKEFDLVQHDRIDSVEYFAHVVISVCVENKTRQCLLSSERVGTPLDNPTTTSYGHEVSSSNPGDFTGPT